MDDRYKKAVGNTEAYIQRGWRGQKYVLL